MTQFEGYKEIIPTQNFRKIIIDELKKGYFEYKEEIYFDVDDKTDLVPKSKLNGDPIKNGLVDPICLGKIKGTDDYIFQESIVPNDSDFYLVHSSDLVKKKNISKDEILKM